MTSELRIETESGIIDIYSDDEMITSFSQVIDGQCITLYRCGRTIIDVQILEV